ncbi:hypothetical protein DIPPA_27792 [Diplonema papillatum]|nr:hypothetical protein DIPPA_27792 [Diplonema papillatum]
MRLRQCRRLQAPIRPSGRAVRHGASGACPPLPTPAILDPAWAATLSLVADASAHRDAEAGHAARPSPSLLPADRLAGAAALYGQRAIPNAGRKRTAKPSHRTAKNRGPADLEERAALRTQTADISELIDDVLNCSCALLSQVSGRASVGSTEIEGDQTTPGTHKQHRPSDEEENAPVNPRPGEEPVILSEVQNVPRPPPSEEEEKAPVNPAAGGKPVLSEVQNAPRPPPSEEAEKAPVNPTAGKDPAFLGEVQNAPRPPPSEEAEKAPVNPTAGKDPAFLGEVQNAPRPPPSEEAEKAPVNPTAGKDPAFLGEVQNAPRPPPSEEAEKAPVNPTAGKDPAFLGEVQNAPRPPPSEEAEKAPVNPTAGKDPAFLGEVQNAPRPPPSDGVEKTLDDRGGVSKAREGLLEACLRLRVRLTDGSLPPEAEGSLFPRPRHQRVARPAAHGAGKSSKAAAANLRLLPRPLYRRLLAALRLALQARHLATPPDRAIVARMYHKGSDVFSQLLWIVITGVSKLAPDMTAQIEAMQLVCYTLSWNCGAGRETIFQNTMTDLCKAFPRPLAAPRRGQASAPCPVARQHTLDQAAAVAGFLHEVYEAGLFFWARGCARETPNTPQRRCVLALWDAWWRFAVDSGGPQLTASQPAAGGTPEPIDCHSDGHSASRESDFDLRLPAGLKGEFECFQLFAYVEYFDISRFDRTELHAEGLVSLLGLPAEVEVVEKLAVLWRKFLGRGAAPEASAAAVSWTSRRAAELAHMASDAAGCLLFGALAACRYEHQRTAAEPLAWALAAFASRASLAAPRHRRRRSESGVLSQEAPNTSEAPPSEEDPSKYLLWSAASEFVAAAPSVALSASGRQGVYNAILSFSIRHTVPQAPYAGHRAALALQHKTLVLLHFLQQQLSGLARFAGSSAIDSLLLFAHTLPPSFPLDWNRAVDQQTRHATALFLGVLLSRDQPHEAGCYESPAYPLSPLSDWHSFCLADGLSRMQVPFEQDLHPSGDTGQASAPSPSFSLVEGNSLRLVSAPGVAGGVELDGLTENGCHRRLRAWGLALTSVGCLSPAALFVYRTLTAAEYQVGPDQQSVCVGDLLQLFRHLRENPGFCSVTALAVACDASVVVFSRGLQTWSSVNRHDSVSILDELLRVQAWEVLTLGRLVSLIAGVFKAGGLPDAAKTEHLLESCIEELQTREFSRHVEDADVAFILRALSRDYWRNEGFTLRTDSVVALWVGVVGLFCTCDKGLRRFSLADAKPLSEVLLASAILQEKGAAFVRPLIPSLHEMADALVDSWSASQRAGKLWSLAPSIVIPAFRCYLRGGRSFPLPPLACGVLQARVFAAFFSHGLLSVLDHKETAAWLEACLAAGYYVLAPDDDEVDVNAIERVVDTAARPAADDWTTWTRLPPSARHSPVKDAGHVSDLLEHVF